MLLWAAEDRIAGEARALIESVAEDVLVSAASVWEIEIKRALGRLDAPGDIATKVDEAGFTRLAIAFEHAQEAGRLPLNHADPFDRMLVAQARVEGLLLATADSAVRLYEVAVLDVEPPG